MKNEQKGSNLQKIDYIVTKTLAEDKTIEPKDILRALINSNNFECYITEKGKARKIARSMDKKDIISEIAKFSLRFTKSDSHFKNKYLYEKNKCIKFLNTVKSNNLKGKKIIDYLNIHPGELNSLCSAFVNLRYESLSNKELEKIDNIKSISINKYIKGIDKKERKVKNLRILASNNRCRIDVLNKAQLKKDKVEYKLGDSLFAKSMVGKNKNRQEDSVLILEHPKNRDFKLLMVADGVSGNYNGGLASNFVAKKILYWFENLDSNSYKDIDEVSSKLNIELRNINDRLTQFGDGRSTTFLCGIVGKNETLLTSIGDSRAYVLKGKRLFQVSKDDSLVQEYYEDGRISKEDMRFHVDSSYITRYLGMDPSSLKFNTSILRNDDYKSLILLTDGVSDVLSDKKMQELVREVPRKEIAKTLVDASNQNVLVRNSTFEDEQFHKVIVGGKDNETACVYAKKVKRR